MHRGLRSLALLCVHLCTTRGLVAPVRQPKAWRRAEACTRHSSNGGVRRRRQQHVHRTARTTTVCVAAGGPPAASGPAYAGSRSVWSTVREFWRFTRPHTLIGSALCVPALHLFATPAGAAVPLGAVLTSTVWALLPALLVNVYITGLNQITDVEIDRINKPDLPLASGGLTVPQGERMVGACLMGALALAVYVPACSTTALRCTLLVSALLGTLYSAAPFRLKRFPFFAALCILMVRGAIVNVGFYAHALETCFGSPISLSQLVALPLVDVKCMLATLFFAVFGSVIALMKDVPDIVGDKTFNIKTLTVRLGVSRVFSISTAVLSTLLVATGSGLLLASFRASDLLTTVLRGAVGLSSLLAAALTAQRQKEVDPNDRDSVFEFYMFVWKLFYAAYLLLPAAR